MFEVYPSIFNRSIRTTGKELNYVGVGMGFKHVGLGLPSATAIVALYYLPKGETAKGPYDFNVPAHLAIGWAYYGHFRYKSISGKGLSRAEELFASAVVHAFGLTW